MRSSQLLAWAGLQLQSFCSPFPEQLGLQSWATAPSLACFILTFYFYSKREDSITK
jgi:hypothetical protein